MPELPEIYVFCQQMTATIMGKEIEKAAILQTKCLNRPENDYQRLAGKKIEKVEPLGKWIKITLHSKDELLINLGMGGELIYFTDISDIPAKAKFIVSFTDGTGFFVTLWWFGYFHFIKAGEKNPMTDNLGEDPLHLSLDQFKLKLAGKRGRIKSFLLDQKNCRGIGNFYIQEILFQAKLHPQRPIDSLTTQEIKKLYHAIQQVFRRSIELGSSSYEKDFFGKYGDYSLKELSFAYEKDAVCPDCGTATQKIKTGTNAQYICPICQQWPGGKNSIINNFRQLEIHKTGKD